MIMGSNVRCAKLKERQRIGWMDSVKRALNERMSQTRKNDCM